MSDTSERHYSGKDRAYFAGCRAEIEPLLPDTASRVLEIGCGTGATMRWLRSFRDVGHAVGLELVADVAREAASAFDEVLVGNVETMDFALPPRSFDMILALDVLEHMVDPWRVIRRCHQLLVPGGVMIASIPNVGHYTVSLPLLLRGIWNYEDAGLLDRTHLRFFGAKTAIDLMTSSGLIFERIERTRLLPQWLSHTPARLGGRHLRWYYRKALNGLPTHLFDFQFLVRVRSVQEA